MPWTVADVERHKKGLSNSGKSKWVKIANSARNNCLKKGRDEKTCDAYAIRVANQQVNESKGGEEMQLKEAEWTTAFINNLPDGSFAYVEPGEKDSEGKTKPRSKRHFPIKDSKGKPDAAHVRNALARAPQSPFGNKALPKIKAAAKSLGIGQESADISFTTPLLEASALDQNKGIYEITIIREGFTEDKKRYYPKSTLAKAAPLFEGAKAYVDHPTKTEIKDRPERSIKDLAGDYQNVRYVEDGGIAKIKGELHILESKSWVKDVLNRAVTNSKFCGTSIHADGWVNPKAKDGSDLVEAIEVVASADIVTEANAGGRVERLIASNRGKETGEKDSKLGGEEELDYSKVSIEELTKERPDLLDSIKETYKKEAEDKNKVSIDKNEHQSLKEAQEKVEELTIKAKIADSKILDVIKKDEDKKTEEEQLMVEMRGKTEEEMDKVIESRKSFIKSIGGPKVTGNPAKEDQGSGKKAYHIGTLLPEAKVCYAKMALREAS